MKWVFITAATAVAIAIFLAFVIGRRVRQETFVGGAASASDPPKEFPNLLTKEECRQLIDIATKKGLDSSPVWKNEGDGGSYADTASRSSQQVWFGDEEDALVKKVSKISQRLTGFSLDKHEKLQVAHYQKEGKFNEHFDACINGKDSANCKAMNHNAGQRRTTLIIYLNDDFEGGETEFVTTGQKIKPETGKGLLFWNTDDAEEVIQSSKHRGNPVLSGEKWICTKWTHPHTFR